MERAECSVFIGKYQILQMTWSPLQWRWSLLVQHGAWCWMQEEQLGGSRRNRPTDYLQLCWELSFLNIHIFNQLKRLSEHTDRRSAKKTPKTTQKNHTCKHSSTATYYTGTSASWEGRGGVFACKKIILIMLYDCDSWNFINFIKSV